MSGAQLVALAAAVAGGVLLPKTLPAALVGRRLPALAERFLGLLPGALLGGLVTVQLLAGGGSGRHAVAGWAAVPTWPMTAGVVAAVVVAAVTRRGLLAMLAGWAALAAGLLVR
jgi:branched-subunit amino acid transport protein